MTNKNTKNADVGRENMNEVVVPWKDLPENWSPQAGLSDVEFALFEGNQTQQLIATYGLAIISLLLKKNRHYGNSALEPIAVFAKNVTRKQRMAVRMDDKISRLMRGVDNGDGESATVDLVGYLVLDMVGDHMENNQK